MNQGTAEPSAPASILQRKPLHWGLFVLCFLALGSAMATQLYLEYSRIQGNESDRLLDVSRTVANNLQRQFEGLAAALDGVRDDYRAGSLASNDPRATRELQLLAAAMQSVNSLTVTDARGVTVAADQTRLLGSEHGADDYFTRPRNRNEPNTLFVSRPSPDLDNSTTLYLSKSILSADGQFIGVVSAGLSEEFFATVVRSALFAPDMRATLIHADGTVFLTAPKLDSARRRNLATPGSLFSRHMAGGLEREVLLGTGPVSGTNRLVAYSNLHPSMLGLDRPLVLALSRDPDLLYAVWRQHVRYRLAGFLCILLLAGTVRVWGHRRERALAAIQDESRQALDASALRLDSALEGGNLGLWEMNLRDNSLLLDARGCAMLGYGPAEVSPSVLAWTALMHPADRDGTEASFERYLQSPDTAYEHEFRLRHKDGRWIWVLARGKVARYGRNGRPANVIGTAMDLSERKARETALAQASMLMRRSGQLAKVGGWVLEADTNQLTWAEEVFRIHEFPAGAAQPDVPTVIGCYVPEARAAIATAVDKCLREGIAWDMELEITTRRGNRRWLHTQGEPVYEEGRIVRIAGALQDVTERKRAALELERVNTTLAKMSYTDALTALGNRRLFDDALQAEWNRAARSGEPLSILMIDIDYFKRYNDLYGHPAGDRCLQQVAMVLQGALHRVHEKAMRYGGEEFAILLPRTDLAGAEVVAHRVLASVAAADICHDGSPLGPRVTVSLGAACHMPRAEVSPTVLVREADRALYRAKEEGRGRLVMTELA